MWYGLLNTQTNEIESISNYMTELMTKAVFKLRNNYNQKFEIVTLEPKNTVSSVFHDSNKFYYESYEDNNIVRIE